MIKNTEKNSRLTRKLEDSEINSSDELLMTNHETSRYGNSNMDAKSSSSESCHSSAGLSRAMSSRYHDEATSQHAISQWLKFLQMDTYLQGFLDNGYDDFETIKQIGQLDLEAIGVNDPQHAAFLLDAVRVLREQGAVWVYLLQDEQNNEQFIPDRTSGTGSSGIGSGNSSSIPWTSSDHDPEYATTSSSGAENSPRINSKLHRFKAEVTSGHSPWSSTMGVSGNVRSQNFQNFYNPEDEDLIQTVTELNLSESGRSKRSKKSGSSNKKSENSNKRDKRQNSNSELTSMQLAILVKEKLHQENLNLSQAPFNSKAGDDFLTGLASRYAVELGVDEVDVLHQLDDLRHFSNRQNDLVMNISPRKKEQPISPIHPMVSHNYANLHDTRTYSPGIYASSSCLSDKQEDIYDLAAKYEGSAFGGDRTRFLGSPSVARKSKLSPPWWYTKARNVMTKTSKHQDDFMTGMDFSRNRKLSSNDLSAAFTGSPTLFRSFRPRTPSHDEPQFSTRTRLRPGGPRNEISSRAFNLPVTQKHSEEISMLTMSGQKFNNNKFLYCPTDEILDSHYLGTTLIKTNHRNLQILPTTPIVKQKTSPNSSASPRVQMYRTRVIYNESRPGSAGLYTSEAAV